MVKRYAHLSPIHLNEHARQIDAIFNDCVPNMSHEIDLKLEVNTKSLILLVGRAGFEPATN